MEKTSSERENIKRTLASEAMECYLQCLYDSGKSFEYLTQQLRVGLCGIARQLNSRLMATDPSQHVMLA